MLILQILYIAGLKCCIKNSFKELFLIFQQVLEVSNSLKKLDFKTPSHKQGSNSLWLVLFLYTCASHSYNYDWTLKGLSSENKGGSNYTSVDSSCLGLWSRRCSFVRNTAAILKSAKNISAQYNTRMYNCWVTLKACWKGFSVCFNILL